MHEVSLAHTHAAVEEEGIVGLGGALSDCLRGGPRKLFSVADDESLEGVARIEFAAAVQSNLACCGPAGAAGR